MFKLSKKIAVVTGASRGIGKAMAETYAQAGAHVICVSRNEDALNGVANLIRSNGGLFLMGLVHTIFLTLQKIYTVCLFITYIL